MGNVKEWQIRDHIAKSSTPVNVCETAAYERKTLFILIPFN